LREEPSEVSHVSYGFLETSSFMRRIGTVANEQQAQTLRDYLFTRDVEVQVDEGGDGWNVWVLDEDQLDAARQELEQFQADPQAQKYAAASTQASARRQARLDEELKARKRQVNMRERWERPVYQRIPVTILLIVASIGVTVAARFGHDRDVKNDLIIQHVTFVGTDRYQVPPPRLDDVLKGEVWRLITPIFLHLGWLHIVMNMYILFLFGGSIEEAKGPRRFLAFVLIIAVVSNIAQFFMDGPMFGGMSGVDFGLFGYLWMKSKFAPEEGFYMPRYVVVQLLAWALLCMTGLIGQIANTAHIVGLASGMAIALTPVVFRHFTGR
jgi:GlpG protein